MRRLVVLFVFLSLLTPAARAADDAVTRAMKLYEKRHYAEAAAALRADLASVEPARQGAAQLTLGMIYLKNAELHRELYQESLAAHLDYLKKLAADRGRGRSRFADLYLGKALLDAGKPGPALASFEKFVSHDGVDPVLKAAARADMGLCLALQNDNQRAGEIWDGLAAASDPETKAALAAAYSKAGLKDKQPATLADQSLAELRKSGAAPSMRHLEDVMSVYAAAGLADKGLDVLRRVDLKAFSTRESVSKTKIINFYDVSLLGDLSTLYLEASIAALEKAAQDGKLKETASFYLGEAFALKGDLDQSIKATNVFIGSSAMPQQYREKATVRQAANQYRKGRQFDAIGTWDELSKKQPEDPDLLAEILNVCGRLRIDCPKVAKKAAGSVESGEGKRFLTLNIALGRYYLARKDYPRAVSYLEAGRDKGNKNKIESNDPVMLVSLAQAYHRTKKFSEALEIYFEMSRQFSEVRQIQEALQGIYAMEHKSAGDVKIN